MNAIEFVKEYGLDYSKGVLEVVPKSANFVEWYPLRSRFYITDVGCNRAVLLTELKQVVEAFELVEKYGGINEAIEATGTSYIKPSDWEDLNNAINLVEKCYE